MLMGSSQHLEGRFCQQIQRVISCSATFGFIVGILILAGCATTTPPQNKENVVAIFNEYPHWYKAAKKTEKKWGIPVNVQMAIIYYESAFKADARPPRRYYLGLFPGKHISSAYGYAQVLDGTWDDYLSSAGGWLASRTKFASATDFIGWYSATARDYLGISQDDPYNLYLAYHEGLKGYQKGSYLKKSWLMNYAKKVAEKSKVFQHQLAYFEGKVPNNCYQSKLLLPDIEKALPTELEPPNYLVYKSSEAGVEENI